MRRALIALIVAISLFATASFAGMAVFGMHDGTAMGAGMMDMDCLGHCMASAAAVTNGVMPVTLALVIVLAFVSLLVVTSPTVTLGLSRAMRRSRDGIGKYLLHQQLATIVLRN